MTSSEPSRHPDSSHEPRPPGRGRRRRGAEEAMVPEAEFSSYYGRQVVKPAPWTHEIPIYLYTGGLAAGSALIAAGAELTGRRTLQHRARATALAALGASTVALVADLGKPSRFLNMLRTVKLTSPMSIGSWILVGFGGFTGAAAAAELAPALLAKDSRLNRPLAIVRRGASLGSAAFAPPLAAYTAVLLSDTATPTWHAVYKELPFVFVGSALAASGGAAMITTPASQTAPARRLALAGTALEIVAAKLMYSRLDIVGEPLHEGRPGGMLRASEWLMIGGAATTLVGGRWRPAAVLGGLALNVGSALTRFGVFEAGIDSAKDPKYTVVPQRRRLERQLEERQPSPPAADLTNE